jgi:phosphate:Na+ symporter
LEFSWWFLLYVAGSLGLFIYGLKLMSEGIQRAAGPQMRKVLSRMTGTRLTGILTGFTVTSIIQSSSASTVLTVGFVNAGLVNLSQAVGVIMGINVGTTITGWLISILDLQFQSTKTVLPLLVAVVPMLFSQNKRVNAWGDFFMGFLLLVIGLIFMKDQMPDFSLLSDNLGFIEKISTYGYLSLLIMFLIGALMTALIQSSTATMALTIILCNRGWLPFDVAAAMILGANVGTTITAEIAALIGNTEAKRVARVHTLFNLLGSLWMFPLLPFFIRAVDAIGVRLLYDQSAYLDQYNIPLALSVFHSSFNILNTLLFLFIPQVLSTLAVRTVRIPAKKSGSSQATNTDTMPGTIFSLPELSIIQTRKRMADLIHEIRKLYHHLLLLNQETEKEQQEHIYQLIGLQEKPIQLLLKGLDHDLKTIMAEEISQSTARQVYNIQDISLHLNSVHLHAQEFRKSYQAKNETRSWFDPGMRHQLRLMLEKQGDGLRLLQTYFEDKKINEKQLQLILDQLSIRSYMIDEENYDNSGSESTSPTKSVSYFQTLRELLSFNQELIAQSLQILKEGGK